MLREQIIYGHSYLAFEGHKYKHPERKGDHIGLDYFVRLITH
jgi:hypothetical protein